MRSLDEPMLLNDCYLQQILSSGGPRMRSLDEEDAYRKLRKNVILVGTSTIFLKIQPRRNVPFAPHFQRPMLQKKYDYGRDVSQLQDMCMSVFAHGRHHFFM